MVEIQHKNISDVFKAIKDAKSIKDARKMIDEYQEHEQTQKVNLRSFLEAAADITGIHIIDIESKTIKAEVNEPCTDSWRDIQNILNPTNLQNTSEEAVRLMACFNNQKNLQLTVHTSNCTIIDGIELNIEPDDTPQSIQSMYKKELMDKVVESLGYDHIAYLLFDIEHGRIGRGNKQDVNLYRLE